MRYQALLAYISFFALVFLSKAPTALASTVVVGLKDGSLLAPARHDIDFMGTDERIEMTLAEDQRVTFPRDAIHFVWFAQTHEKPEDWYNKINLETSRRLDLAFIRRDTSYDVLEGVVLKSLSENGPVFEWQNQEVSFPLEKGFEKLHGFLLSHDEPQLRLCQVSLTGGSILQADQVIESDIGFSLYLEDWDQVWTIPESLIAHTECKNPNVIDLVDIDLEELNEDASEGSIFQKFFDTKKISAHPDYEKLSIMQALQIRKSQVFRFYVPKDMKYLHGNIELDPFWNEYRRNEDVKMQITFLDDYDRILDQFVFNGDIRSFEVGLPDTAYVRIEVENLMESPFPFTLFSNWRLDKN